MNQKIDLPDVIKGKNILLAYGTEEECAQVVASVGKTGTVYYYPVNQAAVSISMNSVIFVHGAINQIQDVIPNESLDVILFNYNEHVSVKDKESLIAASVKLLKNGGELIVNDLFLNKRLNDDRIKLLAEYITNPMEILYYRDFERLAKKYGYPDPRIYENKTLSQLGGSIEVYTIKYHLWKINGLEDACEDFGHRAIYTGNGNTKFKLDHSHIFENGKPERICGNTMLMLSATRFSDYFKIEGNFNTHLGAFKNCGTETAKNSSLDRCECE